MQAHHQRFLQACAGVEALEDQVGGLGGGGQGVQAVGWLQQQQAQPAQQHAWQDSCAASCDERSCNGSSSGRLFLQALPRQSDAVQ